MGEHAITGAEEDDVLLEHLRSLADLHEIEGDPSADPAIVEALQVKAQEAEDAYLRVRELPSTEN